MLEDSQFWTDLVLDQDAPISPAEFLDRARRAANEKSAIASPTPDISRNRPSAITVSRGSVSNARFSAALI
jgi:hypothetical protein